MRFPVSLPPLITVGEDVYDIPQVNALTVVRRVAARTRPFIFRYGLDRDRRALQQTIPNVAEALSEAGVGTDRRVMCRRIYHLSMMLDTRSGTDRRQHSRREKEIATHIVVDA